MRTPRSANDIEPYFRPDAGGSGTGTWHEISKLPLTEPKVSSVEASVWHLDQWESEWMAWHNNHVIDGSNPEYVKYGDLSDEDRPYAAEPKEDGSWEEDSDTEFLMKCCGEDRPLRKRGIKLVVTSSTGNDGFVTVHDYVSAVHPCLMSLRGDIVSAKTAGQNHATAPTEWMVDQGPEHMMEEKTSWLRKHGGGPPLPMAVQATKAAFLSRIRAERNR